MALLELWQPLDPDAMADFAAAWLAYLRGGPSVESDIGQAVVMMNFLAQPDQQWLFIRAAVAQAESDDEIGHIAAGPLEHILGHHGEAYFGALEGEAVRDAKFARMLTGAWQYMMPDAVWSRVQAIQARVPDPLRSSAGGGPDAPPDTGRR
jgi:hypothetical protein